MKKCSQCKELKEEKEFCKRRDSRDGLNSICRSCANKKGKSWREKNPETKNRLARDYYHRHREREKARMLKRKAFLIEKIFQIIGITCVICGETNFEKLLAHEIHGKKHHCGNPAWTLRHIKDFICLCYGCHQVVHYLARKNLPLEKLIDVYLDVNR